MKLRTPWISLMGAGALLVAGQTLARQAAPSPPTAPPATPAEPAMAPSPATQTQAVFQTPQGEVTVRSALPPPAPTMAAPAFEQLSGGGKFISTDQANAYPPLANDFDYADSNRDHRISAAEYARWSKQR
ncbi:hypothetical protein ISP17_16350 [Dyella ginsengisoli]|uniref:EF-hand domain-containing protein n=1 Tax=Dyella ginsengisoli TaxID=363848 RepID=A0ABW8JWJ7_9GAMM